VAKQMEVKKKTNTTNFLPRKWVHKKTIKIELENSWVRLWTMAMIFAGNNHRKCERRAHGGRAHTHFNPKHHTKTIPENPNLVEPIFFCGQYLPITHHPSLILNPTQQ